MCRGWEVKIEVRSHFSVLEVETLKICNLLMGIVAFGQDPCSQGDQKCAFGDCRRDMHGVGSGPLRV